MENEEDVDAKRVASDAGIPGITQFTPLNDDPIVANQQANKKQKGTDGAAVAAAAAAAASAPAAPAASAPAAPDDEQQIDEDAIRRRRAMNTIHSRRKRERQKIEIEVLRDECANFSARNRALVQQNAELQELIRQANSGVAFYRDQPPTSAVTAAHVGVSSEPPNITFWPQQTLATAQTKGVDPTKFTPLEQHVRNTYGSEQRPQQQQWGEQLQSDQLHASIQLQMQRLQQLPQPQHQLTDRWPDSVMRQQPAFNPQSQQQQNIDNHLWRVYQQQLAILQQQQFQSAGVSTQQQLLRQVVWQQQQMGNNDTQHMYPQQLQQQQQQQAGEQQRLLTLLQQQQQQHGQHTPSDGDTTDSNNNNSNFQPD